MKLLHGLMIVVLCGVFSMYAPDQFYIKNGTSAPINIIYKTPRESKFMNQLSAGENRLAGIFGQAQQMFVKASENNGSCSYFGDIGMNSIYQYVTIKSAPPGVALVFSDKPLDQGPTLQPIVFFPEEVDNKTCSAGSDVVLNKQAYLDKVADDIANKAKMPLIIENKCNHPVKIEVDLGSISKVFDLAPAGSSASSKQSVGNNSVYNITIYSGQDYSCTKLYNVAMHPFFNRLYILPPDAAGIYKISYGHIDAGNAPKSPRPFQGNAVNQVLFQVFPNSEVQGTGSQHPSMCWSSIAGQKAVKE